MRVIYFLLAIVAAGAVLFSIATRIPSVQDKMMDRMMARVLSDRDNPLYNNDGLKVVICGTGSPLVSLKRAQVCTAVIAGDRIFLVDAGTGSWEVAQSAGVRANLVDSVLLTHFHSDHLGDLSEVNLTTWVSGRQTPLPIYGPDGVERVVNGINEAFSLDYEYRTAHHGKAVAPPRAAGLAANGFDGAIEAEIYNEDGLVITAFPVRHDPVTPAVGYRFEYQGRSVAVSGDTAYSKSLIAAAKDVDVLIHEAQANHMVERMETAAREAGRAGAAKIMADIQDYHTTPVEAARAANEAGAAWLVLTHLTPPPDNRVRERIFMRGVSAVRPRNITLAEDGMIITLPREGGVEIKSR